MGKSAVLLVLIGLAAGLWLGFNPTTHRELARWWTRTVATRPSERPSSDVNLRQLDHRLTQWLRTGARPATPPPAQKSPVPSSDQISTTLQAFWHALQQLWVQFLLKLGITRT